MMNQHFFDQHDEDGNVKVEMQIALPGRDPITMKTLKGSTTEDVYKVYTKFGVA